MQVHADEGLTGIGEVDTNSWVAKAHIESLAHTSWGSIHVPISERTPLREVCHATKMGVISFPLGDAGGFSFLSLGPTLRNSHLDSHGLKPIITYLIINNWEAK